MTNTLEEIQGPPEPLMVPCCHCSTMHRTLWAAGNRGMINDGKEFVLVADWIICNGCFDRMIEQDEKTNPPRRPRG